MADRDRGGFLGHGGGAKRVCLRNIFNSRVYLKQMATWIILAIILKTQVALKRGIGRKIETGRSLYFFNCSRHPRSLRILYGETSSSLARS